MKVRTATREDATAIAIIYNQGIQDRVATFETDMRSEIGIHEKHAKLDGVWRDVIIVKRLIETNCT